MAASMPQQKPAILMISQVYPPDPAAVGQYMHDAAAALVRQGCRVTVYCANRGYNDPAQKYAGREVREGVEIRRLPLSSLGKKTIAHRLLAQSMFLSQAALRGLLKRELNGILVSTSPPMASIAALVIRLFRRVPVKFWVMDLNPDQLVAMGKVRQTSLIAQAFNALNRMILRAADDVIALDRFMADRLTQKLDVRFKLTVLPPWPLDAMEPVDHAENPFRTEHGLEGKFVVMYSGNHGQTTPVTTLLEAAVRMQDRSNLVFMFIGGGVGKRDVEAVLERYRPANIISLPYQPLERLRYSLSAADVHVVTMDDAVVGVIHPCKVYGAMALARPVLFIGPDQSHVGDIMRGESIGWRVRQGDVDGTVAALDEMLRMDPGELKAMGRRATQIVNDRFQRGPMIKTFSDVVLRNGPRPLVS
jgi:glycosyltransferase involved in cell wall biosynthesis